MSERVSDERKTELLRMRYVEGLSTRAIAKKLGMARRTVRALLGEQRAPTPRQPPAPRESIVAPFEAEIRARLASDRDLRAPALLEHLRLLGYRGGISVLRERMRQLRPRPHIEVFSSFTNLRPAERMEVDWAHFGY
ncbi:MAG: family transposase, partial [Pseudomonadota bacterium]